MIAHKNKVIPNMIGGTIKGIIYFKEFSGIFSL